MRLPDWPERLSATFLAARGKPYAFGRHDCVLFACDCAAAILGEDPGAWARGTYRTYAGGLRKIARRWKVASLEEGADLLFVRVPVALAQRGDWALANVPIGDGETALGLCVFDRVDLVGPCGVTLPRAAAQLAWHVS